MPGDDAAHVEHERHMRRALELAALGRGLVSPNPMVGAVVVRDGDVVGEGWHEGPGTPHAEVRALAAAGDLARGATLYCTLEPCDHVGRTPPCTSAIVDAGVARAVVAAGDPNPVVDGRGFARLRAAGVQVETGVLEAESRRLNAAFERHVVTGLPFVTLKTAASLDGRTAARDGTSRWITGEDARNDAHVLRGAADAIVAGAGTVIADDPLLTVRDPSYRGDPPLRVVVDASGRVPPDARIFDRSAPTLIATTERADRARADAWACQRRRGRLLRPGRDGRRVAAGADGAPGQARRAGGAAGRRRDARVELRPRTPRRPGRAVPRSEADRRLGGSGGVDG